MRSWSNRLAMLCLMCGCAGGTAATVPPSAADASKTVSNAENQSAFALVGDEGLLVEVVALDDSSALLRVSGLDSPLGNNVYRMERATVNKDLIYSMQWKGRRWDTLMRSGDNAWFGRYWRLYPPGGEALPLAYSADRKVDAAALAAANKQQSGKLEQLQRFDQSAERAREEEYLAVSTRGANGECGSNLTASIAWETVDDQALLSHSVSDYCTPALQALRSACASAAGKSFVKTKVQSISCRLDGRGEMSLSNGQLSWSINFDATELDSLASQALKALHPSSGS